MTLYNQFHSTVALINVGSRNQEISLQGALSEVNFGEIPKETNTDKTIGQLGVAPIFTGLGLVTVSMNFVAYDPEWADALGGLSPVTLRMRGLMQPTSTAVSESATLTTTVRGRTASVPLGRHSAGDRSEWPIELHCTYVEQKFNGVQRLLLDLDSNPNIFRIGGVDQIANLTSAL